MKNVKECRDVNRQKCIRTRSGCYRHTSHTLWTHTTVRIVRALRGPKGVCCVPIASRPCSDTFLTVHIPTFLHIFHEMFFTTLGPVLLSGTNFSVLINCCIWRVLTLAFSYSCSIHNIIDRTFMKQYKK